MAQPVVRTDTSRTLAILSGVVVVFFIAFALYWARAILIPLTLAVFFSFILSPLVIWLQKRGLGRVPSVLMVVFVTLLLCVIVGLVVGRQMVELTRTLPDHAEQIKAKVETMKGWMEAGKGNRFTELINDVYRAFTDTPEPGQIPGDQGTPPTVVVETSPSWVARAQSFLSPAAEALGQAAFTFVLLLFMLLKREDLRNRVIRLVGPGQITTTTKAVDETSQRISRYLFVQFILNASFGIVVTLGLLLIGVRYAPLWGFVGFLMRYVPYIGTWIGLIPPALFAFAVSDGWMPTILVIALFISLELLCNNVLEPLLYGKSLGLSEVAQLVAAAFWAFLWGPIGLILSGPLTTCLLVIGKYVPQWRFLTVLLGDEPVLTPRVAFYQRLTARDQDEAAEIVEKELANRSIEQVFDDLFVSALTSSRSDAAGGRISDDDLAYITASVREVAEEVAEVSREPGAEIVPASRVRVLLIPAKDAVDQVAAELISRLLRSEEWEPIVAPAATLTSELLDQIEADKPASLVIVSLPPGGLTHTRYLVKRIRQRFKEVKIAVCRWARNAEADSVDTAAEQLRSAGADEVTSSLENTRTFLQGWQSVLASDPESDRAGESKKKASGKAIGTTRA